MWWKTSPDLTTPLRHLQERVEHLSEQVADLRKDLSETSRDVRTLDLDMVGLEDKVKAFTGRVSVRKRKDRQPEPEPEAPFDLNEAIRNGKVTSWPLAT